MGFFDDFEDQISLSLKTPGFNFLQTNCSKDFVDLNYNHYLNCTSQPDVVTVTRLDLHQSW